jgi:hypothetical protein
MTTQHKVVLLFIIAFITAVQSAMAQQDGGLNGGTQQVATTLKVRMGRCQQN